MNDTANTEETPHQGETDILIRIDLRTGPAMVRLDPLQWSKMLTWTLTACLRGRGVLAKSETIGGPEDGRIRTSGAFLTQGGESIGSFAVTDWPAAIAVLADELEAHKLAQCSAIGYFWKAGMIWIPAFPERSTENFEPIAQRFLQWVNDFNSSSLGGSTSLL
ncbi:MAG TPA: hypothetical protein VGR14_15065 [Verrucomicrobiae bacterium]|jgi:hypothetical protein|nr:hypothetical protein [Verrucomicrobiae bacterium]